MCCQEKKEEKCFLQRQETRMLGDWEESKRLITKHPFKWNDY